MTNTLLLLSLAQGILLPIVVSFLKGQQWSSNVKLLFSLGVSVVVASITILVQQDFNWKLLVADTATVWATAQVIYRTWFQDTAVEAKLASMLPWSKVGA